MAKKQDKDAQKTYQRGISRRDARALVHLGKPAKVLLANIGDVVKRNQFKNLILDATYFDEVFKRTSGKGKKDKEAAEAA